MNDLDLTDIDPLKWAEVRRRAHAVRAYLALPSPDVADRERFAASLDLGAQQFANIVKAWTATRDAAALSPSTRRPERASRSKRGGVDPRARDAARAVIAELGQDATLGSLANAVRQRCATLGIEPPSRGTVWLLSVEARGGGSRADPTSASILVARAFLKLPVDMGVAIVIPEIAIAVETATGMVVAATMPRSSRGPDVRALADRIADQLRYAELPLAADERDVERLRSGLPPFTPVTPLTAHRATHDLAGTLGRGIGRLGLIYRTPTIRPATLMQSGRDCAPSVEDAATALDIACRHHNEGLAAVSAPVHYSDTDSR